MHIFKKHYELGLCEDVTKPGENIHYEWKDLHNFKITRPTIIALSGNNCVDTDVACGFASIPAMMINPSDDIDIVTVAYKFEHPNVSVADFSVKEANEFAYKYLIPLVSNKFKRLTIDEACKNIRLVTIFSYCYGNVVKCMIMDEFDYMLKQLGYDLEERTKICSQIVCVGFAPMQDQYIDKCTNFFIKSFDDSRFGEQFYHEKFGTNYHCGNIENGVIERYKNTINFYCEKLNKGIQKGYSVERDNHNINLIRRNQFWDLYMTLATDNADTASQCTAYALAMSCANSLENYNSNNFVAFDTDKLEQHCKMIIKDLNKEYKNTKKNKKHNSMTL